MLIERPRVAALVALKAGDHAKSRLADVPDDLRRDLAWSMALDTLTALHQVLPLVVVSDQAGLAGQLERRGVPARVVAEAAPAGLNAALRHGDHELRTAGVRTVVACVGDLPALTPADVAAVVARIERPGRHLVPDRSGVGTTMLVAHEVALDPLFQGESAARHLASGAVSLVRPERSDDLARARCDVDTVDDLAVAYGLGLGPASAAVITARPDWAARLEHRAAPR